MTPETTDRSSGTRTRYAIERVSHRFIFRRSLPPPFPPIPFYVSSEAGLKYLRPSLRHIDPPLLGLVREFVRPGSAVWDIGTNVGLFAFAAAAAAGRHGQVIAVEPDTWLVGLLRRSAGLAGDRAPVVVVPAAASDRVGLAWFHIARRNRATNYLEGYGSTQTGGSREQQVVPTIHVDLLREHFPWPDVVKIDVEGAERLVLGGADRLLEHRPVIICEVAQENSEQITAELRAAGYQLFDGLVPAAERRELDRAPFQTLAIPTA